MKCCCCQEWLAFSLWNLGSVSITISSTEIVLFSQKNDKEIVLNLIFSQMLYDTEEDQKYCSLQHTE